MEMCDKCPVWVACRYAMESVVMEYDDETKEMLMKKLAHKCPLEDILYSSFSIYAKECLKEMR